MASLASKYYRARSRYWRENRILYPSPAEVALLRLMGGKAIVIDLFKHHKTGFSLTFIISMGSVFAEQNIKREVRVGKHWVDFGNDLRRGIEVDGKQYHGDIVKQVERDEYFQDYGWAVLHIKPIDIYSKPNEVQRRVLRFLND